MVWLRPKAAPRSSLLFSIRTLSLGRRRPLLGFRLDQLRQQPFGEARHSLLQGRLAGELFGQVHRDGGLAVDGQDASSRAVHGLQFQPGLDRDQTVTAIDDRVL